MRICCQIEQNRILQKQPQKTKLTATIIIMVKYPQYTKQHLMIYCQGNILQQRVIEEEGVEEEEEEEEEAEAKKEESLKRI